MSRSIGNCFGGASGSWAGEAGWRKGEGGWNPHFCCQAAAISCISAERLFLPAVGRGEFPGLGSAGRVAGKQGVAWARPTASWLYRQVAVPQVENLSHSSFQSALIAAVLSPASNPLRMRSEPAMDVEAGPEDRLRQARGCGVEGADHGHSRLDRKHRLVIGDLDPYPRNRSGRGTLAGWRCRGDLPV